MITVSEQCAISFIKRVAQKYPFTDARQFKKSVQAVLRELVVNLPPDLRVHFFAVLPEDVHRLADLPPNAAEVNSRVPGVHSQTEHMFLTRIRRDSGLTNIIQAKKICYAVLSSLTELFPADKSFQIRSALPVEVKQLWTEALREQTTYSLAMQRFHEDIRYHYRAADAQQLNVIIQIVISRIFHRFGKRFENEITIYLPEEIRLLIGETEPCCEATEEPGGNFSPAELIQIIQQEANLISSEDARLALLGIFRAIKKAADPITCSLLPQFTGDWVQIWQSA